MAAPAPAFNSPRSSQGHPLHGPRLKIEYAIRLIDRLNNDMLALFRRPPRIGNRAHDDRLGQDLFLRLSPVVVPDEWSLRIGSILHHLRSGLDQLAWKLDPAPSRFTAFPPCKTPGDFKAGAAKLGLPRPLVATLEAIRASDALDPPGLPLVALHQLWNADKHWVIPIVALALRGVDAPPVVRNARLVDTKVVSAVPALDGAPLGSFRVERDSFDAPYEVEWSFKIQAVFGDLTDDQGRPLASDGRRVIHALKAMTDQAGAVIAECQAVFPSSTAFWPRPSTAGSPPPTATGDQWSADVHRRFGSTKVQ